jgi:hypothetical protein
MVYIVEATGGFSYARRSRGISCVLSERERIYKVRMGRRKRRPGAGGEE